MLTAIPDPPKNNKGRAKIAHEKYHLQRQTLIETFKINRQEADEIVRSCERCKIHIEPNKHPNYKTRPPLTPTSPMVRLCIDVIYMTPKEGKQYLLVGVDAHSRYTRLIPLTNLNTRTVFDGLINLFSPFGQPAEILADYAGYFFSPEMKALLAEQNILLRTFSIGNSNANLAERQIKNIRGYLKRQGLSWVKPEVLKNCCIYLNIFCNCIKIKGRKVTPFERFFRYVPPTDLLLGLKKSNPVAMEGLKLSFYDSHMYAESFNNRIEQPDVKKKIKFKIGQKVMYKKYSKKDSTPLPGTVEKIDGESVIVRNENRILIARHFTDILY